MESELRHVLERLSGQFDALSSELAAASTEITRLAVSASATTVAVQLPAVPEAPVVVGAAANDELHAVR